MWGALVGRFAPTELRVRRSDTPEVPDKFQRIRDKNDVPPALKQGPSPPGPLFSTVVRGKHRMRHPVRALFRVTALAALFAFPTRALAEAAPDPDEAVDQITQMNRDAVTAYQAKKYEDARKVQAGAGPRVSRRPGQAPAKGAHPH